MEADEDVVLGDGQVGLDEVGFLRDGELVGRARVLGRLARGAAVGDQLLRRIRRTNSREHRQHHGDS